MKWRRDNSTAELNDMVQRYVAANDRFIAMLDQYVRRFEEAVVMLNAMVEDDEDEVVGDRAAGDPAAVVRDDLLPGVPPDQTSGDHEG